MGTLGGRPGKARTCQVRETSGQNRLSLSRRPSRQFRRPGSRSRRSSHGPHRRCPAPGRRRGFHTAREWGDDHPQRSSRRPRFRGRSETAGALEPAAVRQRIRPSAAFELREGLQVGERARLSRHPGTASTMLADRRRAAGSSRLMPPGEAREPESPGLPRCRVRMGSTEQAPAPAVPPAGQPLERSPHGPPNERRPRPDLERGPNAPRARGDDHPQRGPRRPRFRRSCETAGGLSRPARRLGIRA